MRRIVFVVAVAALLAVSAGSGCVSSTVRKGGSELQMLTYVDPLQVVNPPATVAPAPEQEPVPELMNVPEPVETETRHTNLPPYLGWVGPGTFTAGSVSGDSHVVNFRSDFTEAQKFWTIRDGLKGGIIVAADRCSGKNLATAFDFKMHQEGGGVVLVSESNNGIAGHQTELSLSRVNRTDTGHNNRTYEMEQNTLLYRWKAAYTLYQAPGYTRWLNRIAFIATGDVDRGHDKTSSVVSKGKRIMLPLDTPESKSSIRLETVVNIYRFGSRWKDFTIAANVEYTASREDGRPRRWKVGPRLLFLSEHLVVMPYYQYGEGGAEDRTGIMALANVWSWKW